MIATTNLHDARIYMTEPPMLQLRSDFETFVRDTYPGLVGVATALTGNGHDAQDMVQHTMLKAFTGWPRVQYLDHPAGWAPCQPAISRWLPCTTPQTSRSTRWQTSSRFRPGP